MDMNRHGTPTLYGHTHATPTLYASLEQAGLQAGLHRRRCSPPPPPSALERASEFLTGSAVYTTPSAVPTALRAQNLIFSALAALAEEGGEIGNDLTEDVIARPLFKASSSRRTS